MYWQLAAFDVTNAHRCTPFLTHLPLDKMAAIAQTVVSDAFLSMKILYFY